MSHLIFAPHRAPDLKQATYALCAIIKMIDRDNSAADIEGEARLDGYQLGGLLAAAQTIADHLDAAIASAIDEPYHCHPQHGAKRLAEIISEVTHGH